MNKVIGIAILAFLSCLPMPIAFSESIQAQTVQGLRADADRLLESGNQQSQKSQYREAIQTWEKSLQIYREIKNRKGESNALNNIGNAYSLDFGQD
jgi:tetratricopeptide (TPR) repeat protein